MTAISNVTSPRLREHYQVSPRNLAPHHSSSHHSKYEGCLNYSNSELHWKFSGQAPNCSWVHSGGSSGSSSNGGSSGGGYGDDDSNNWNGGSSYDDDRGSGGGQDDNTDDSIYGGGYGGNDDDNSEGNDNDDDGNQGANDDDEFVVSNEDVYNGNSEYDPIDDFDIEVCNTYANLWLWDLGLSCDTTGGSFSLKGCNCTFAEELMDNELLTCDDVTLCPDDCLICATCLKLLGCDVADPKLPGVSLPLSTSFMLYIIAAAVALLIFGLVAYYARRKRQDDHDLNKKLIEKQRHEILDIENGPSFMYINGDLTWKPLRSDQQYSAQQIQPVCTMSTVSTGKYLEERVQPSIANYANDELEEEKESLSGHEKSLERFEMPTPEDAKIPTVVETLDNIENRVASSIHMSEDSSDEENYVFEDAVQSPISLKDYKTRN